MGLNELFILIKKQKQTWKIKHYQQLKKHLVNYVRVIHFWMLNYSSTGQSKEHNSWRNKIFCLSSGNADAHSSKNSNIVKYYYSLK